MTQVLQLTDDIYQFEPGPDNSSSAVFFVSGERCAVIETGPAMMTPHIMEGMSKVGRRPEDVAWIMVTHIHMDHAGGMGALARLLPGAKAVVHKEGARHMIDPTRLIAGTRQAFGEDFEKRFGAIQPVPETQLVAVAGGESFSLGGRELRIIDAPGHAPHHLCIFDTGSRGLFAGEALGSFHPGGGSVVPGAAPPAFDPDVALETMKRLEELQPAIVFYSHQGAGREVKKLIALARKNTVAFGEIILAALKQGAGYDEMSRRLEAYLRSEGASPEQEVGPDGSKWLLMLQGYEVYFKKRGMV